LLQIDFKFISSFSQDAEFQLPIYLEPEIESFFKNLAQKQKTDLNDIVNKLLLKDKELLEMANLKNKEKVSFDKKS